MKTKLLIWTSADKRRAAKMGWSLKFIPQTCIGHIGGDRFKSDRAAAEWVIGHHRRGVRVGLDSDTVEKALLLCATGGAS